ncbi:hypothetical protein SUGI_0309900 [Cryptomeria japonica]|nr:hypothetical protein SUGI_0309900 [Cryptomeria japonica]
MKIMEKGMNCDDYMEEKKLKEQLAEIIAKEEIYWRDKAREIWIKEKEKNTTYFHSSVKTRMAINKIIEIECEDDKRIQDRGRIGLVATDYILGILNSANNEPVRNSEELFDAVPQLITTEDNEMLMPPFFEEEIRSVLFDLHLDKALGLDGFPARFYQSCWDFMKVDIWKVNEEAHKKGKFVKELNNTILVIIPKKFDTKSFG